jgi:hypothetical protein
MEPLAESLWSCENCDDHNNQNPPADNPCRCCKRGGGDEERYRESRCSILNRVDAAIAEAEKKRTEAETELAAFKTTLARYSELLVVDNEIVVDTTKPEFELPASRKLGDIMGELEQLRRLKRDHPEIVARAVKEATRKLENLVRLLDDRLSLLAPHPIGYDDGPPLCPVCSHMLVRVWPSGKSDLSKKPRSVCPTCMMQEYEKYHMALKKIDEIRNSIVGSTTVNWSEHIYPLVAALNEAGFVGIEFVKAREDFGTLTERCRVAEERVKELAVAVDAKLQEGRSLNEAIVRSDKANQALYEAQHRVAMLTRDCRDLERERNEAQAEIERLRSDVAKHAESEAINLNRGRASEIEAEELRKRVAELEGLSQSLSRQLLDESLSPESRTALIGALRRRVGIVEQERDVLKQSIALKCDGSADKRVTELEQARDDARESANVWSDDYQKLAAQFAKLEAEHARLAVTATDSEKICGILKQRVAELEQALQREIAISKEHIVELEAKLRSFGIPVPCEVRPDVRRGPDDGSELYSNSVEHRAELGKWLQETFPQRWSSHYNAFGTMEAAMKFLDSVAQVLGRYADAPHPGFGVPAEPDKEKIDG